MNAPEDATDRNVIYTVSDAGVASIRGRELKGLQPGECELTVQSKQNPEVVEIYHVLVTTPVDRLTILAPSKTVAAGGTMQLEMDYMPTTATIRSVEWSSRAPTVAVVDENGLVRGLKKGRATIDAKARDGSGKTANITLDVAQIATSLRLKSNEVQVVTGRTVNLTAEVLPRETNDRTVSWYSSDEGIATVRNGQVRGVKAGVCEITCVSNSNPELKAVASVEVIQLVTRIEFDPKNGISLPVRTTRQLSWNVLPADASHQEVAFASSNTRVATVDADGVVTGVGRGTATITATAQDGSRQRGSVKVEVTQPVEGVSIQYDVYHIQLHRNLNVRAIIQPSNANNQLMHWTIEDPYVATVRENKNIGNVYGAAAGITTITGTTDDGGFTDTAEIRVADFNGAVMIEDLRLKGNDIRIQLRNMSDFVIEEVYMTAEVWNYDGEPLPCNPDDGTNIFKITYRLAMWPGERSDRNGFHFYNGDYGDAIGRVTLRVTGWKDSEGYMRTIYDEADQPVSTWTEPQAVVPVVHTVDEVEPQT